MECKECTCPKVRCKRHGKCEECRAYHGRKERLPYCERDGEPDRERISLYGCFEEGSGQKSGFGWSVLSDW